MIKISDDVSLPQAIFVDEKINQEGNINWSLRDSWTKDSGTRIETGTEKDGRHCNHDTWEIIIIVQCL